ncbi:ghrelin O-acyltransferase, partial [Oreochromis niloticus]|uniref:ghrelin O-acyltransferase n=1 Tax=Oreochromis niloticus TaxID=8128 RepID=UPI000DF271F2
FPTYRYLFVSAGGSVLAVITMGIYSTLLFTSTLAFVLLVCCVDHSCIHTWAFLMQMLWQTFWHLLIQYREYYLHEPVSIRLFLAVSTLMLLTQRITSVSLDLQEKRGVLTPSKRQACVTLLPLISYILNFTTLLGGPLGSYGQFITLMEGINLTSPPRPLGVVFLKLMQVLMLEWVRFYLVYFLKYLIHDFNPGILYGILSTWCLGLVLRIQYYSHWKISECLNNAAGFGFWEDSSGDYFSKWSGLSDGDFWTTEASICMSQFTRRWNATTASWLRRLVYARHKHFPLFMCFGFSLWWHGLHLGHFVGFFTWAATVKADHHIHRNLFPNITPTQRKIYTFVNWINTQMVVTCIVIAVEFRNLSGLNLLSKTYIGLFPLVNIILLFIILNLNSLEQ